MMVKPAMTKRTDAECDDVRFLDICGCCMLVVVGGGALVGYDVLATYKYVPT